MLTGIDVVYIPYKSVGLVVTDLLAGRMDAQITNVPAHVENVRNGKLRAFTAAPAAAPPPRALGESTAERPAR
jgi:tripartite-type tricarboxylate transporter receptor subunit TctC